MYYSARSDFDTQFGFQTCLSMTQQMFPSVKYTESWDPHAPIYIYIYIYTFWLKRLRNHIANLFKKTKWATLTVQPSHGHPVLSARVLGLCGRCRASSQRTSPSSNAKVSFTRSVLDQHKVQRRHFMEGQLHEFAGVSGHMYWELRSIQLVAQKGRMSHQHSRVHRIDYKLDQCRWSQRLHSSRV